MDVHSLSSWRAVDAALEIHVELLKSCSRGFDEKSSKSETSSDCTFSLLTIDESDWLGGTWMLSGKWSDFISLGVGWILEQSFYTNE